MRARSSTPFDVVSAPLAKSSRRRSPRSRTSDLNSFSFVDADRALQAAERADVSRPFGGVPVGVKELEPVAGWPDTEASLVYRDRVATHTSTVVERLLGARRRRRRRAHHGQRVRRTQRERHRS